MSCRRNEWIEIGAMDELRALALEAYDRYVGLELSDIAVDCCITKAPCGGEKAGRSPVDRGKRGTKRSMAVDACGIPVGFVIAPANRHDSPLLAETLDAAGALGELPEATSIHLDRGYDSEATRRRLRVRGLVAEISKKGKPAPLTATKRCVVERTASWHNAHKKLVWCTERKGRVIDFWVAAVLSGQIVAVPIVNMPAFEGRRSAFVSPLDGKNLKRIFPGGPMALPARGWPGRCSRKSSSRPMW